ESESNSSHEMPYDQREKIDLPGDDDTDTAGDVVATPEQVDERRKSGRAGRSKKTANGNAESGGIDASELLRVLQAVNRGDFSVRCEAGAGGVGGRIADVLNEIIDR